MTEKSLSLVTLVALGIVLVVLAAVMWFGVINKPTTKECVTFSDITYCKEGK